MNNENSVETEVRTFRDFLSQYNKITEKCFRECIRGFTERELSGKEEKCIGHCLEKYMKTTQRTSMRFAEFHMSQNEGAMTQTGQK